MIQPSKNTWSELEQSVKDSIVRRVENGEKFDVIADEFNLRHESFARHMRRILARRRKSVQQAIVKNNFAPTHQQVDKTKVTSYFRKDIQFNMLGDTGLGSNPGERMMFVNTQKPLSILYFTDAHFPYQDKKAIDAFIRACNTLPHDMIINGGDTLDLYGLSKYGKDPKKTLVQNVKAERDQFVEFAYRVNDASPTSEKLNIFGNHMFRYIVWQRENPSIMAIDEMQIDALMQLNKLKWHLNVGEIMFNADHKDLDFPKPELIIHHGTLSRKHAGNSSRTESETMGYVSSISGHVHRLGVSYKKTLHGQILMAEGGCLRDLHPDYSHRPDAQNGFLYLTFVPNVGTFCQPVLIHNGRAYHEGKQI